MYSKIYSGHPFGVEAILVSVETNIERGLPAYHVVGLPDSAVRESRERVRSAILNSGFSIPPCKIVLNLAPANFPKSGSSFDLPMAISLLESLKILNLQDMDKTMFIGELALDGSIRPVRGILPVALEAERRNFKNLIVPYANRKEAAVCRNINIFPVNSLTETCNLIQSKFKADPFYIDSSDLFQNQPYESLDFSDIKGQFMAKRAMEVAATGGHNLIMVGPPGSGKTMLARRLPSILPRLTLKEAIDTTKIYSVSGSHKFEHGLIRERPFRSPHHTISDIALIGGGRGIPNPGEVSLAHHGVLFLDELPEFKKNALEVLRQPMEDQHVTISRAAASLQFPAQFMLVAAMNPSPKGYDIDNDKNVNVDHQEMARYLSRLSGPLLDRIDIHIEVPALPISELQQIEKGESSNVIRSRVENARQIQIQRFKDLPKIHCNAAMGSREIREFCYLKSDASLLLKNAIERFGLSARAYDRILRVGRTIADLDQSEEIKPQHIAEAIQYRSLDKKFGL